MTATEVNVRTSPGKASDEMSRWPGSETGFFRNDLLNSSAFSLMRKFSDEMDRFFYGNKTETGAWAPAVEIKEEAGKFRILAELPGLKPENVKVAITEDAVVLEGERKYEKENKNEGYYHSERSYGHFYRAIPLPKGAEREKVSAAFTNGVLEVTIPVPEAKPMIREIPVKAGG